jgi:RNA-directed DNA polymerase
MHFAFDTWMARVHSGVEFERYADDAVVHCVSRRQADDVLASIAARMGEVGLALHPDKTRVVYCQDDKRRERHEHTSFTFLGFTFRPRKARNTRDGGYFTSFLPAMSTQALKAKGAELRRMRTYRRSNLTMDDLARWLNPIIAGWMNYYGRYYRSAMYPLLRRISTYLKRWAGKKYRRLRSHKRFQMWWTGLIDRQPGLFTHWKWISAY